MHTDERAHASSVSICVHLCSSVVSKADGSPEVAQRFAPLLDRAVHFVGQDVGQRDEVADVQRFTDLTQVRRELSQQLGEGTAVDFDGLWIDASELGKLQNGILRVLPGAEASAELCDRGCDLVALE